MRAKASLHQDIATPRAVQVYDGRRALGTVEAVNGVFTAVTTDNVVVGTFTSLREACRAFDRGRG
jgi:hypothetical protein